MEQNKISINSVETDKEILNNLRAMMNDVKENAEISGIVKSYFDKNTDKRQVVEYLKEKYNLSDDIVNYYIKSLEEQAREHFKKVEEIEALNKHLSRRYDYEVKKVNGSVLKVMLPFLLVTDLAKTYGIAAEMFTNKVAELAQRLQADRAVNKFNNQFLNKLENILQEEKPEELKAAQIQLETYKQIELINNENPKTSAILINTAKETEAEIDAEIISDTNEKIENEVLLLEHKISKKDIVTDELEHFENIVAENMFKHGTDINAKFLSVTEPVLNNSLKFNLLKQVFPDLNKNEFAKMITYAHAHANSDVNNDLFSLAERGELNEKTFNNEINDVLKNPEYIDLYNNISKEITGVNVDDVKFKEHLKNKNKNIGIGF